MGRIVNQAELVEILGRDNSTIWEWQKETPPLPILERGARGEENKYDTAAVIAWQINRAEQRVGGAKSRLETELLEMEVREKRAKEGLREKTLVPADQVRPVWESRVMTAAAFMASRHSRLAALLETTPGLEAKRELLKREDVGFLKKLGVDGERMQIELEKLLETIPAGEVEMFWQRLHGDADLRI